MLASWIFFFVHCLLCCSSFPHRPSTTSPSTTSHRLQNSRYSLPLNMGLTTSSTAKNEYPVCLVVTVEIKEDRIEEFLRVIEADAIGSRTKENGGCLRFDVLRSNSQSNKFIFYEVYKNEDCVAFHKATDHFALWTNFKSSGGVLSQTAEKADGIFL